MTESAWPDVALGDVAVKLQDGPFGSNLKSLHYVDAGTRVVRLQNIGVGAFVDTDRAFVSAKHFDRLKKHRCVSGDVLVATLGDPILRACRQPAEIPEALNKADCVQLRCDPELALPEYVVRVLNSPLVQKRAELLAHGQTRPRINLGQLSRLPVPLPPIEEQRRVAAVLDKTDELRAKRQTSLALFDLLVESIFLHIPGGQSPLEATVGQIGEIQGGLQVTRTRERNPIDVPYLRVANVHRGRLDVSEIKSMRVTNAELERTRLLAGDLLVVEGHGNAAEIGRVARWVGVVDPCVHQNHLIRVRVDPDRAIPEFVEAFLNSQRGRQSLLSAARTTSGLNTISVKDVKAARLLLPPLEVQRLFANQLSDADRLAGAQHRHRSQLDALFSSLQHRAFAGQL